MRNVLILALLIAFPTAGCLAQSDVSSLKVKENPLSVFDNLVGGKWSIDATWSNGMPFRQERQLCYDLDKNIVNEITWGTIDQESGEFGLRNRGVRTWNKSEGRLEFYEFDRFGGVTVGTIIVDGDDFTYEYAYQGDTYQDVFKKESQDRYSYSIVVGGQIILSTYLNRVR